MDFNFPLSSDPRRINLKGKTLVAHQPECLPWLGFISKAPMGDIYLILDTIQFVKEHWHNKNKIKTPNGEQWLIVPIENKNKIQQFTDVRIANIGNWKRKHLNAIKLAYSKTPYFSEIFPEIEEIYSKEFTHLIEFNEAFIRYGLKKFNINVPIIKATDLIRAGCDLSGQKSDLIINLCKAVNCDNFVFGQGGKTYMEKDKFKKANIHYVFQTFDHPIYTQHTKGDFIKGMSFIDLLFNYGPDSYKTLTNSSYEI